MLDSRILAVILLLGLTAIGIKLTELFGWAIHEEPIVVDTSSNGGVSYEITTFDSVEDDTVR